MLGHGDYWQGPTHVVRVLIVKCILARFCTIEPSEKYIFYVRSVVYMSSSDYKKDRSIGAHGRRAGAWGRASSGRRSLGALGDRRARVPKRPIRLQTRYPRVPARSKRCLSLTFILIMHVMVLPLRCGVVRLAPQSLLWWQLRMYFRVA
jgi:hypothetical protein